MSKALYARVHQQAGVRCGFCRTSWLVTGEKHTIEHIIPTSRGGSDVEDNLWVSCRRCNECKRALIDAIDPVTRELTALFNPRHQIWNEHFAWSGDGTQIIGLTSTGRATVSALKMNHIDIVNARRLWVSVGWHPPIE